MTGTRSVLVVNTGSSSLKWVELVAETEAVARQGDAHWDGAAAGRHSDAIAAALEQLGEVAAVGHRVVHGGRRFREGVRIDADVRREIDSLTDLAPLHNPAALAGIDATLQRFPAVPQVAVFDTAFHATIPEPMALYPLPWDWTERWQLRRFGFHGLSVSYAVGRSQQVLGDMPERLVVCHLGAGCSVTAVDHGRSIDTSMGFTPLEGVMMAQRSGSVDPGLLTYVLTRQDVTPPDLDRALNQQSGLLGVSGVSADMREVLAAAAEGHVRARLARDMFVARLVASVGGMIARLKGLEALVFTGGIGEHSAEIRAAICDAFGYIGLRLDAAANAAQPVDRDVAKPDSRVRVLVLTAREDLAVLREVKRVLQWQ